MKHNYSKYSYNDLFIETGSWKGDGIQSAIEYGFKKIISIELSEHYYNHCTRRFRDNPNVFLYHGDSSSILPAILLDVHQPATFWLDGHFSGGNTACGDKPVPLFDELTAIQQHSIKTHTILIDDIRLLRSKTNQFANIEFTIEDIIELLLSINENYHIYFIDGHCKDDILVAEAIKTKN